MRSFCVERSAIDFANHHVSIAYYGEVGPKSTR